MRVTFLIIFISFNYFNIVKGNDCISCTAEEKPFTQVEKNIDLLQNTAIVNCIDELKKDADNEYIENFSHQPKKTEIVRGVKLSGSTDEVSFLKKMLGTKPMGQWEKAKGCETVLCALTNVYNSEEAAKRTLNIAKRTGYIVSIQKDFFYDNKDVGQLFSLDELQVIDLAYKKLPTGYKHLRSLNRLKRLPDGLQSPRAPNAAAYSSPGFHSSYYETEGEITFLDGAFNNDKTWGPLVAVHELSHHVDFSKSEKSSFGHSESSAYLKLSGWKKKESYTVDKKTGKKELVVDWEHEKDKKFVTPYAATEPAEDLGDSAAFYVYEPNKLKAIDPEKYEYLKKNLFGGKEYTKDPEFNQAPDDIFKRCIADNREITLWGNAAFNPEISSNCMDNLVKEFSISDPKLCDYSKDSLKKYLFDKINPLIETANLEIKKCDASLKENKKKCTTEFNFQRNCAIEKCHFDDTYKSKIKEVASYVDSGKLAYDSIQKTLGKTEFITMTLINGLSGKDKVSANYSLNTQRGFLDNAGVGLAKYTEKENYKFDSKLDAPTRFQSNLMMDKSLSESLIAFQEKVLKSATRSKEKNLDMIKAWASSQSLENSPQFETLAEALIKYK